MKYAQPYNTGSESWDEHTELHESERTKETFPMKVGMQCILKTKQTKSWIEPRYSRFKRRTIYTKMHPQHLSAEWTTGCNLGKLGGMLPPPSIPS